MYFNYRCRACGKMVSKLTNDTRIDNYTALGVILPKELHPHCLDEIEDGEKVLLDLISLSEKPLQRSVDTFPPVALKDEDSEVVTKVSSEEFATVEK